MKFSTSCFFLVTQLLPDNGFAFTAQQVSGLNTHTKQTCIQSAVIEEEIVVVNGETNTVNGDVDTAKEKLEQVVNEENEENVSTDRIQSGRYNDVQKSLAVPFLDRSTALDGSHAGDLGFDPIGLAEDTSRFNFMAECEVKHARLAMLAVVGWPMAELLAPKEFLQTNGMAPSVLNGFHPLAAFSLVALFGAYGKFEYERFKEVGFRSDLTTRLGKQHKEDMANIWEYGVAGDYNFDPLDLYPELYGDTAEGRRSVRDVELANGRAAMLAITGIAFSEKATGHPIVENNMLFHPNVELPAVALALFTLSQFIEVTPITEYPVRIQMKDEGKKKAETLGSVFSAFGSGAKFLGTIVSAPVKAVAYIGKKYGIFGKK